MSGMENKIKYYIILMLILGLWALTGCGGEPGSSGPEYGSVNLSKKSTYRFAIHPLHNPTKLFQAYQPLADYLSKQFPDSCFVVEASRDYASYEAKFKEGRLAFLLPNPWQTLQAIEDGYEVIAMAGDARDFKGIFIVRKDSKIEVPTDLKGETISYPAPTALAACIMPQNFLFRHGLDINKDVKNLYVGSQESSIMNVFVRQSIAGATWPPPWRAFQKEHPNEAAQLKLIWETPPLINNSVMVHKDLPPAFKKKVQQALLTIHESSEGRAILSGMETSGFFEADNESYNVVRTYIDEFEKNIRRVDQK